MKERVPAADHEGSSEPDDGRKSMVLGGIAFILGLIAAVSGCSESDGGGGFRVSWGAMAFGGFKFLKGAAAAAKYEEWKGEGVEEVMEAEAYAESPVATTYQDFRVNPAEVKRRGVPWVKLVVLLWLVFVGVVFFTQQGQE